MYRENFALFLAISLLPTLPLQVAQVASTAIAMDIMQTEAQSSAALQQQQMTGVFLTCGLLVVFMVLQFGVAVPLATGALTVAVTNRYLGRPVSLGSSYAPVFRNFGRYLATSMVLALVHGFGMICTGYILFLFTWVWFLFVPCVMMIEGLYGTEAMGRSRALGGGHPWRIFGASVALFIVTWMIKFPLPTSLGLWLASEFDSPVLQQVVQGSLQIVINALVDPVWSAMAIMLYFDMRIRKEGYDLALVAHRVGRASPLAV